MVVLVNFIALRGDGCRYALEMTMGLAQNGIQVIAVISSNMENIQNWRECKSITCYEVNGYTNINNFIPRLLHFLLIDMRQIRKIKKDAQIGYVYVPIQTFWTVFMEALLGKHRLIYTMHDPIPHKSFQIMNLSNNYCAKKARILVLLSKRFNNYVEDKFCPKRVVNLCLGSQAYYTKKALKNRKVVEYDSQKINLVFHGIINEYKGLHVLAEAYKKITMVHEDVTLSIIGSGDFKPYEEEFANLPNVTVVNRWLLDEEVAGVYKGENIIAVLPYLTATQSGVVTLAMQSEVPIIATDCGGLSEQIVDGETGYLVPPGNVDALYEKILYVIDHPEQCRRISKNARLYIESIDSTGQARILLDALLEDQV